MNIYTYMHAVPTTSVQVSSSHIHIQIDTSKIHRVLIYIMYRQYLCTGVADYTCI